MFHSGRQTTRRWGRLAAAAAVTAVGPAAVADVPSLTWDASAASPMAPVDGSGVWNAPGNPVWSNGSADVPWTDGAAAYIGNPKGSAAYTISLAANVSAASVEFDYPGAGASYTLNGNGHTLAIPSGNLTVVDAPLTLTNGTFSTGDATGNNPGGATVESGGVLTVGPGAVLATSALNGDSYAATVYFNGGTYRALANPPGGQESFDAIAGTTAAYISSGGLAFDTTPVAAGIAYITDPLSHDPAVTGPDGGLTVTGGGLLQLGFAQELPAFNPVYTYTGNTAVIGGTTLRLDTAGNTAAVTGTPGTGPFPDTRFTVAAGSTLAVAAIDGVVGQTGTNPVTLNGGTLTLVGGVSAHLANVTLNGGNITADASGGQFTFGAGAELHATANASVNSANLAFNTGSDVRVDAGATLAVSSPLGDGDTPGQLTKVGAGAVLLTAANPYTGPTNVSAGMVNLATGASLTGTPSVTVATGATLLLNGTLSGAPTLTTGGTVTFGNLPGTGINARALGSTTINAAGAVTLAPSTTPATRTVLVVPSLTINAGGKLELGNGDLDVSDPTPAAANVTLANLTTAAASGYAGGTWSGIGLSSAAAAADSRHLTAVGVVLNVGATGTGPMDTSFDGQAVTATNVLARYTYYGDTNLDGVVNGADYSRVDAGFIGHLTGWANGDFNYDGLVDGSDYTLMDNAFNEQLGAIGPAATWTADAAAELGAPAADVPEPTLLPTLIAVGLLGWRRRKPGRDGRQSPPARHNGSFRRII